MDSSVIYTRQGAIASIILNRPKVKNAINGILIEALKEALEKANHDPEIKVIILSGKGDAFSVGGDTTYIQSLESQIEIRQFLKSIGDLVKYIRHIQKTTIAMVQGIAAGVGLNLALACDVVLCSDNVNFEQSHSSELVWSAHKKLVEESRGLDTVAATTAFEDGIIDGVYKLNQLATETMRYAESLVQGKVKPVIGISS